MGIVEPVFANTRASEVGRERDRSRVGPFYRQSDEFSCARPLSLRAKEKQREARRLRLSSLSACSPIGESACRSEPLWSSITRCLVNAPCYVALDTSPYYLKQERRFANIHPCEPGILCRDHGGEPVRSPWPRRAAYHPPTPVLGLLRALLSEVRPTDYDNEGHMGLSSVLTISTILSNAAIDQTSPIEGAVSVARGGQ